MKNIIVYDFDKTIYSGETGTNFLVFYAKKKPLQLLLFGIVYIKDILKYTCKMITLKILKERFYGFLNNMSKEAIQKIVAQFWEKNEHKIYPWVKDELVENKKHADYLIAISASPIFLIETFLQQYGFDYVFGTEFLFEKDQFQSKIIGENCKGKEKVNVLNKWAEKQNISYNIAIFYSDSIADKPLFDIAEKKYWIKKGKKIEGMPTKKTIIDRLFWK